ncbi:ParB N-terminal domain-containing protein [Streptomyces sp. ISL-100]|uniref:ParB N-terminal domain-containing protein n=1 Tax=Streptomyces sp. ISL-100 TaxID=2819173 RepID=UPI001BE66265|nr:ParB N-terminal domain-containing protein [Streptomyces sp. ISL-100]MBT2400370.1 ParB N-terminal domain-containing protein [Streptomyces sp. ISL-100]
MSSPPRTSSRTTGTPDGDVPAITKSLTVNGQYKAIVVNRGTHTGRPNEILAGNHTYAAAAELGWEHIAATWVDVDDEAAARIVIVDNRSSDLAGYDTALLAEILAELPDLNGTGYDQDVPSGWPVDSCRGAGAR